jgi:hypothetical protein
LDQQAIPAIETGLRDRAREFLQAMFEAELETCRVADGLILSPPFAHDGYLPSEFR